MIKNAVKWSRTCAALTGQREKAQGTGRRQWTRGGCVNNPSGVRGVCSVARTARKVKSVRAHSLLLGLSQRVRNDMACAWLTAGGFTSPRASGVDIQDVPNVWLRYFVSLPPRIRKQSAQAI